MGPGRRPRTHPRTAATLLLLTGTALTAYTAIQCVPMPAAWLATIAPRNADVWSRVLTPLHEAGPSWAPLSLDPTATRIEALKGVAYLLAFLAALRLARNRDGAAFLSNVIVATGMVLAAAALLHPAFGAHKLYGVWTPSVQALTYEKHVAPFLNPNNLAAYLNVAFCLAFAATLAPDPRWPRPILAAAALFLAATQIWVASRGGVATLVLGAALVVFVSRAPWFKGQGRRTLAGVSLVLGLVVSAGAFMAILGTSEESASELLDADTSKFRLAREALRMIPAFPIFGAGRGAFESTFPAFRDSPGIWTFTYPEKCGPSVADRMGPPGRARRTRGHVHRAAAQYGPRSVIHGLRGHGPDSSRWPCKTSSTLVRRFRDWSSRRSFVPRSSWAVRRVAIRAGVWTDGAGRRERWFWPARSRLRPQSRSQARRQPESSTGTARRFKRRLPKAGVRSPICTG